MVMRNKFASGVPAYLKYSVVILLFRSEFAVEPAATELESLNALGIIGSWGIRGQVVALNHQRHGGMIIVVDL